MGSAELLNGTLPNESSNWKYYFTDLADPRTNDWFMISSPIPLISILASYLYIVKVYGPRYMKDKKPFKLQRVIQVYNVFQIVFNSWMFYQFLQMWSDYNWKCQPVDKSNSPSALRDAHVLYIYFINKLTDFFDTIFFVLRKKDRQISFLHVFHHTIVPCVAWCVVKYTPGGHGAFAGLPNTFVHIILYGYYFLASLGPEVQKYLWWKKYITQIQLVQFCMIIIHQFQLFVFECDYPKFIAFITTPNAVFFLFLFGDFYIKSYNKNAATKNNESMKKKL